MKKSQTKLYARLLEMTIVLLFVATGSMPLLSQCNVESTKHLATDVGDQDRFGRSISVSGNFAVVGAYLDDNENGIDAGSAYFMELQNGQWSVVQKVLASDGHVNSQFGFSVAISGQTALISAPNTNGTVFPSTGAVYVFQRSGGTWAQVQKLVSSDGVPGSQFGSALSLEGNRAVIGSQGDFIFAGAAYVFEQGIGGWSQTTKLIALDRNIIDLFGSAVSLEQDRILVGAPLDDNINGQDAGSAYIFEETGGAWSQTGHLLAASGSDTDLMGGSVELAGSIAFCGAPLGDVGSEVDAGIVHLFDDDGTGYSYTGSLTDPNGITQDGFGTAIAQSQGRLLIGAPGVLQNGIRAGAVLSFSFNSGSWVLIDKLTPSDGAELDTYGTAVALSGLQAFGGSPFRNEQGAINSGAVYSNVLNRAPKAHAGSDVTVFVTDLVALDGSGSIDPDGDLLNYNWSLDGQPTGSIAGISDPNSSLASLVPDVAGNYSLSLIVDDGCISSGPNQVVITAITVADAASDLQDLIASLKDNGVLNNGQANSLSSKVANMLSSYDKGKINAACNKLQAFINQVDAFLNAGILTLTEAQSLLDIANSIGDHLGCNNSIVIGDLPSIPDAELGQSFPNPTGGDEVQIPFAIFEKGVVSIELTDQYGKMIRQYDAGPLSPGHHSILLSTIDLPSGIYYYRMVFGDWAAVRQMVIQK